MVLVGLLAGHFMLVVMYLSGPNLAKAAFGPISASYTRPFFRQNWHLFSPNPGISSRKLAIRCQGESGPWTEWFDPLEPMFTEFFESRSAGLSKLIFVYRGIADALLEQAAAAGNACKKALEKARSDQGPRRSSDPTVDEPLSQPEAADAALPPGDPATLPEELPECGHGRLADDLIGTPAFENASRYARHVCDSWLDSDGAGDTLARYQFKLLEFFPLKYSERIAGSGNRWSRVVELPWPVVEGTD